MVSLDWMIQYNPADEFFSRFFTLPRVDYFGLLASLEFPIAWVYDDYFRCWTPIQLKNLAEHLNVQGKRLPKKDLALLAKQEVVKIPSLLSEVQCKELADHFDKFSHLHQRTSEMYGISRKHVGNLPLSRFFHQCTENLINDIWPEKIKTSYSLMAEYDAGSILPAHTDRSQCQLNVSIAIRSEPIDWPFFIESPYKLHEELLEIGDAVLYKGTKHQHWRNKMPSDLPCFLGAFFHYVEKDFAGSLD